MPRAELPHAKSIRLVMLLLAAAIGLGERSPASAASDLDRAYRTIAGKKFVDLTHSFAPDTPVWSGFGQARMTPAADPKTREPYTIPKDGFRTTFYEMVGQYGTHIDPPAHFAENGVTMDKIPVKQMILPLVVLDDTRYILQQGHFQIEVMANLDQVPARGALIVVTWPKVKEGLGFPARAFAILP
jgi:kynurenine formamidase